MLHKTKEPTTNVSLFENGPSGPCEGRRRDRTNLVKETTKVKKYSTQCYPRQLELQRQPVRKSLSILHVQNKPFLRRCNSKKKKKTVTHQEQPEHTLPSSHVQSQKSNFQPVVLSRNCLQTACFHVLPLIKLTAKTS